MHAVFFSYLKKKTNKGNNELIQNIHEFCFFIFILREIHTKIRRDLHGLALCLSVYRVLIER